MKYPTFVSTRSASVRRSASEALLEGLAPDGGLFVPEFVPHLRPSLLTDSTSIADIGAGVLADWFGAALDGPALEAISREALDFPVPLVPLNGPWEGVHVLELFHGPTLSFKDFGARTMARLMSRMLPAEERLTILVATSGDTGSAVADGFSGQQNIDVILLYPRGQVSEIQERQLIAPRAGVNAFAVEGTFDDCQRLVKEAFESPHFAGRRLSSANSINIGRLIPQMFYYLEAMRTGQFSRPPTICVPSGNLGNLTAGILAHRSGMAANAFLAAHNANDFFPRFLSDGDESYRDSTRTYSNAMDVGVPSNFERIRDILSPEELTALVRGMSISDEATLQSIRRVREEAGYTADPHTAVGLEAVRRHREAGNSGDYIVLATAHPAKFPDVVERAIGELPEIPPALEHLEHLPWMVRQVPPAWETILAEISDGD